MVPPLRRGRAASATRNQPSSGSLRCTGGRAQHVAPPGWWAHARNPVGAGMTLRWRGSADRSGCWEWQGRGARLPGAGGAGRRQGYGGDGCGTQTVMTRCPDRAGQGYVMTRCPRGGTQTVLTRRPRRTGEGYVSTRCPCGGTQSAMPRRRQRGGGSFMTRCPRLVALPPSFVDTMIRVLPCRAVPGAPGWSCICHIPTEGHIGGCG